MCRGLIEAPPGPTGRRPRSTGPFPWPCAGASLKRAGASDEHSEADPLSLAMCRGLIEAGILAPLDWRTRPLSLAMCRGLIEAPYPFPSSNRRRLPFPWPCAGASLKRTSWTCVADAADPFPWPCAGASLKRRARHRYAGGRRPLSLAMCRGLIEAGTKRTRIRSSYGTLSLAMCRGLIEATRRMPAFTAFRPSLSLAMCRGLIEAFAPDARRADAGVRPFPGHVPGPH